MIIVVSLTVQYDTVTRVGIQMLVQFACVRKLEV